MLAMAVPRAETTARVAGRIRVYPDPRRHKWNAYLVCTAKATLACDTTTTGCERIQSGYLMCQSQFTVKIGCAVQGKDPICPAAKPYGLSCRTIPASCDQIVVSGGGSQLCCAAFPPM